jgi:hypothetical protein
VPWATTNWHLQVRKLSGLQKQPTYTMSGFFDSDQGASVARPSTSRQAASRVNFTPRFEEAAEH